MNEEVFRKPPVRYPGEARQLSRPFERARGWEDSVYGEGVDDPEEQFNPLQLLLYVVRYRWLIASFVAFGVVTGIVITLAQTPRYRAEALLELVIPSAKAIQDLQVVSETADLRTFKTALEKLRSREMAQRVVHELGLTERADFLFPDTGFALQNLVKRAFAGQLDTPMGEMPARERERRAIARVHDGISMKLLHGTSIIAITYSSENPVYARRIANQFANTYIAQRLDQTTETSNLARRFISEQVAEVKRKLENSERALLNYAKAQGITVTGEEGSLVSANIKSINQALSKAIEERLRNERLVRQIEAGEAEKLEQVLNNEAIQQNRARIAELKAAYQQKRRRFKPEFPAMRQLAAQIQELEKLLHGDIGAIAKGIRLEYQSSIQKEKDLRRKLAELETQQAAYQDKNIKYTILKREVDSYRAQYKSLIDKLNELGVSSEIKNKSASIVQYADTPDSPFSPRLSVNLALALALSAFMAGGGAYLSELLNNTFSDPDQLESELNLPALGILPCARGETFARAMVDPRSALSEAYRTLRTSIQFSGVDGAPRSLLVTSTEPGEGKSSVVRKLAEEFAALGHHVLIVDADMRRPVLHRFARVENSMGLSNLLTNNVPVERAHEHIDIMSGTPWPNVWMVSAGTLPPNPANLLASKKMGLFIEACTQRFDIVIIDSPPVIGLADALLLSRMSEATLLVVSAHQVARKAAHNAHKRLRSAGAHVIGAALNKFRIDRVEYNYAYRYMNYGYLTYGAHGDRPYQAGDGTANGSSRRLIKGRKRPSLGRFGWGKRTGSSQRRRGADRNHASSMGPQA